MKFAILIRTNFGVFTRFVKCSEAEATTLKTFRSVWPPDVLASHGDFLDVMIFKADKKNCRYFGRHAAKLQSIQYKKYKFERN